MVVEAIVYEGSVSSIYTCTTCEKLILFFEDWCKDEEEQEYESGCIYELLLEPEHKGKTPERLLSEAIEK